jgi:tripartite-type tricarboxylate transporter receptor subunit TctC
VKENNIGFKKWTLLFCVVELCLMFVTPSYAAPAKYPARQIEIIVPYAAGGGVDTNARALIPALEEALGATAVAVNKPGAGGVLGFTYIATSKPDGYTIGLAALSSICTNAALGDFDVDPREAYRFLGGVVFDPVAIAVAKNSPFNTLGELIAFAKSHPNELSYGATGSLSLDAMVCRDLERVGGVEINIVNFDGGAETMAAVMGGHIQIMGGTFSEIFSYHKDGEVKILGVGEKVEDVPDIKSFKEQGYDMAVTGARRALIVPKGVSDEIVTLLIPAAEKAIKSEDFKKKAATVGLIPSYSTPERCLEETKALMDFFLNNDFDI